MLCKFYYIAQSLLLLLYVAVSMTTWWAVGSSLYARQQSGLTKRKVGIVHQQAEAAMQWRSKVLARVLSDALWHCLSPA